MTEDAELLRHYARENSESAFAELVRRHVNFVYACAQRRVGGDAHLAKDVTQHVFTALAREAQRLSAREVLNGWLFTTTRNAAAQVVRTERRRQAREQEAHRMNQLTTEPSTDAGWQRVRPVIDSALDDLRDDDREAVLLRFFEGKSFAEVGARLRLTENTARMRVERALDTLQAALARRGVTSTGAALGLALANQPVVSAPADVAASVAGAALAQATSGTVAGAGKLTFAAAILVCVAGFLFFSRQASANAALRDELRALNSSRDRMAQLHAENRRLQEEAGEVQALRADDAEFLRLRDEAQALGRQLQTLAQAKAAQLPMVTLSGQIKMPGRYLLPQESVDSGDARVRLPDKTLAALIQKAGGPTDTGDLGKIRVSRTSLDRVVRIFVKDLREKNLSADAIFALEPDDIVYVPEKSR